MDQPTPPVEKKLLNSLFHENPATPEGKYLILRRDGTVVEWPSFVLGARDPDAADTLRDYARRKLRGGCSAEYYQSVLRWANEMDRYRQLHGDGDPLMGPHRKDDPETVAKMRRGRNA